MIFAISEIKIEENSCIYFFDDDYHFHDQAIQNIEQIEKDLKINFLCVNINIFNDATSRFSLKMIPTFIFYKNNREKDRFFHLIEYKQFKKKVSDILK